VPSGKDGAIVISNHISYLDQLTSVMYYFPGFVARAAVENMVVVGSMANVLDCIYVARENKDSRMETIDKINQHCKDFAEGKKNKQLMIFPEGTTTAGNYLLQFKKGPFGALAPLQPFLISYDSYSPSMTDVEVQFVFYLLCCSAPWTTITHTKLPVFEPNEYLWEHHQKKGEDKITCYMRVMRKIMLDNSDLKDTHLKSEDRIEYMKALKGDAGFKCL
jgi:1-acyl-sn-glycerol-3-phosphate acyltransferase